ncbi:MAG TPA: hypothetical protein VIX59_13470 [Candidatus Binataceae bacterium]
MNLRHAAALVLVGWYLMMPPTTPSGKPNPGASLSQWTQADDFDTADACHKDREHRLAVAAKLLDKVQQQMEALPDTGNQPLSKVAPDVYQMDVKASVLALENYASRCVATDDPRLKEK